MCWTQVYVDCFAWIAFYSFDFHAFRLNLKIILVVEFSWRNIFDVNSSVPNRMNILAVGSCHRMRWHIAFIAKEIMIMNLIRMLFVLHFRILLRINGWFNKIYDGYLWAYLKMSLAPAICIPATNSDSHSFYTNTVLHEFKIYAVYCLYFVGTPKFILSGRSKSILRTATSNMSPLIFIHLET